MKANSTKPWYQRRIVVILGAFLAAGLLRGITGYVDDNTGYNNQPLQTRAAKTPKMTKAQKSLHVGMTETAVKQTLGAPQDRQDNYWAYPAGSIRFDANQKVVAGSFGGLLKSKPTRTASEKKQQIKAAAKVFGQLSVQTLRAHNKIYRAKKVNDDQTMYAFKTPEQDALVRIDDASQKTQIFLWSDAKQEIGQTAYYSGKTRN